MTRMMRTTKIARTRARARGSERVRHRAGRRREVLRRRRRTLDATFARWISTSGGAKILRSAGAKSASSGRRWPGRLALGVSFVVRGAGVRHGESSRGGALGTRIGAGDSPAAASSPATRTYSSTRRTLRSDDHRGRLDGRRSNGGRTTRGALAQVRETRQALANTRRMIRTVRRRARTSGSGSSSRPRASPCSGRRCRRWCGR